ncbi:MAG TPA: DNA gyrase C-terminal beta-propeller domain-containing protein, partial [Acidimicrobiales bacterium]
KGPVLTGRMVKIDDEVILVSSKGTLIRTAVKQISSQGRDASGVRVMSLEPDETVVAVAPVFTESEEADATPATLPVDEAPEPD